MAKLKRLIFAAVILAVIVVMALRGCPRSRRGKRLAYDPSTTGVTGMHFSTDILSRSSHLGRTDFSHDLTPIMAEESVM